MQNLYRENFENTFTEKHKIDYSKWKEKTMFLDGKTQHHEDKQHDPNKNVNLLFLELDTLNIYLK